jgi:hypothetical protein
MWRLQDLRDSVAKVLFGFVRSAESWPIEIGAVFLEFETVNGARAFAMRI